MQSHSTEHSALDSSTRLLHVASVVHDPNLSADESTTVDTEPTLFTSQFVDYMDLYAPSCTVVEYFDAHHAWFKRCAHPMKVELIGQNAYSLVIGSFSSFGYEIEPKIGLDLLPQESGIYRIQTVPVPDYESIGYEVDFQAAMELVEMPLDEQAARNGLKALSIDQMTRVQWDLDLKVALQFPRFIQALPRSLVQNTGDRLLRQIVRQVSNRLTRKVQEDFCQTYGISVPKRSRKWFFQKSDASESDIPTDSDWNLQDSESGNR